MAYKQLKLWFDKELAKLLAHKLIQVDKAFKKSTFIKDVSAKVESLELKDRVELIADSLDQSLSGNYSRKLKRLIKILGPENEEEIGMFTNFYWIMPIAKFVEKYGLDHFDESMDAIEEITKRNTGEYTIRPFIEKYPKETMRKMKEWSKHDNKHVRRLASEGGRPRLPWAKKLDQFIENPKPLLPILNVLKDDKSKYVQKSVANCLNDIIKDNPEIAIMLIEKWNKKPTVERKWIIKHAIRNLVKVDNKWAISILQTH